MGVVVVQVYVAVKATSGREWKVERYEHLNIWRLRPLGDDVRPAQIGNRMNGGVRSIRKGTEELTNRKRWRLVRES